MKRKRLIKALFLALCCSVFAYAQNNNCTMYQDTCTITKWKADSIRFGTPVTIYNNDLKALICMFTDTTLPGYNIDSVKGVYGYQRGLIVINRAGKVDTSWRNLVIADSFSTLPSDTAGKWISNSFRTTTDHTTSYENWTSGLMDTSTVTGFAVCSAPVIPWYAPLCRPFVKGLTGNCTARWIKVRMQWQERKYIPVRAQ
jgi:hypothetical protein